MRKISLGVGGFSTTFAKNKLCLEADKVIRGMTKNEKVRQRRAKLLKAIRENSKASV